MNTEHIWHKSSYSDGPGGSCVEMDAHMPSAIPIRDSKNSTGPALRIPAVTWCAFVTALTA
ncbi:DUF397 domain-containing protein [Streptomyces griseocarneus]|nr:DUF397 domain-containing protein [Streptomyces griseocarneus]